MKRKLFLGSAVSLLFLYLTFRGIQWDSLGDVLGRTRISYFLLCMGATMVGHFFRAFRWKFMMSSVKDIGVFPLFSATTIGLMANNLLPARLGEVVRAYVLGRQENVSGTTAFATIILERILDIFSLLVLLWFTLLRIEGPPWMRTSGTILLVLNVVALLVILLMLKYRDRCGILVATLTRPFPDRIRDRVQSALDATLAGLGVAGRPALILPLVGTSALVWGFAALSTWFSLQAIDLQLPIEASITVVVIVSLGTMIPSAPAYLGTMQFACIMALAVYGIDKSEALAFSLLFHASQFLPTSLLGLAFLWQTQIGFSELSRRR